MNEQKLIQILSSLSLFAEHFLKIRTKDGFIAPFLFNRAQLYLHERLEEQKKREQKVRALILKGRQQGCSTYVQARDFHIVVTQRGKKAFILTHEAEASKNLFDMTKRYYDSVPAGLLPKPDASSAKEFIFRSLDSGYAVGTAGNKSVGRSQTIQIFHGSEVAYWPNAEEHAKGILQAVPNAKGTEIILESTANGIGNYFYNMWDAATSGKSEFQAIFIPWYWQPEYTAELKNGESTGLTDDEQAYLEEHKANGLTISHLLWRRRKLNDFSNDYDTAKELFNVEYPFTALDAFRNPVQNRFIKSQLVMRARKNNVHSESPLVIGVDPAIMDHDRTAIIRRRGRLAYKLETFYNLNTMEIAGLIKRIIDKEHPTKVCIDSIGIGAGIYDRLREMGYNMVEGVNTARRAYNFDLYPNVRSELWHEMREWLAQDVPVQLPDSDELLGDLTSLGYKPDSSGRILIESKEDLRKRGIRSPDTADALALTFHMGDYLMVDSMRTRYLPPEANGMFT